MAVITRREALKSLGALQLGVTFGVSGNLLQQASQAVGTGTRPAGRAQQRFTPKFFTAHEWRTVRMLADYVIPRDERSGSATDAKVPEFMDFLMADKDASPASRIAMRGGLAWLDAECRRRFTKNFVEATDAQRRQVLDDIAWPARAPAKLSHGVAFFSRFRDLTASGFFSSEMGWKDVRYVGNVALPEWNGCPPEALRKLGVS